MKGVISIQSHVVFGHAGNSSAVFPMQRMGLEVWPIHTVQFSNHTQYQQGWKGRGFDASDISDLVQGIDNIGKLKDCSAVISGYMGSAEQCISVAKSVEHTKQKNPAAIYVCDPVMGDPDKGCIVAEGVQEHLMETLMPMADVIVPNQFELSQFAGMEINSVEDAVHACEKALQMGPKVVLVKHLHSLSKDLFTMMLATSRACYLLQRPILDFDKQPVGVGDLITAVYTASLVNGLTPSTAFKHANDAVYGVLKATEEVNQWEIQTILAQHEFVEPTYDFPLLKVK
ncbi:pyridoxal kinase PdxY [Vibrio agarivorans]|uniref:pyridoxal kinase PdxY n=1 Tax=Vibrio agarivorans TaxID=153622 RepID=UPI0022313F18|nr:pyridoxal kinase PdxY [Vibrio agarivorans]MDN3659668.1 pyridoxal kinase PdxY [Vibrio agarivorans]